MAELKEVLAYLIKHYPDNLAHELSNARLTKMVYLADWHRALNASQQITDIQWYFDNYGPFVRDVEAAASRHADLFSINLGNNVYGQPKKSISLRNEEYLPIIDEKEKASLEHIIEVTKKLYWDDFIKLVYATHPIASSERYSFLDLVDKAEEYKRIKGAETA